MLNNASFNSDKEKKKKRREKKPAPNVFHTHTLLFPIGRQTAMKDDTFFFLSDFVCFSAVCCRFVRLSLGWIIAFFCCCRWWKKEMNKNVCRIQLKNSFPKIRMRPYSQIKQTSETKTKSQERERDETHTSHVNNLLKHCAVMYGSIHGLCKQANVL